MHPLLACLCNSRIVQPAHAGQGPSWPLLLLWGGQLAAAAAGVAFWLVRRRRRRSAAAAAVEGDWGLTSSLVGRPDAGADHDRPRARPPAEDPVAALDMLHRAGSESRDDCDPAQMERAGVAVGGGDGVSADAATGTPDRPMH